MDTTNNSPRFNNPRPASEVNNPTPVKETSSGEVSNPRPLDTQKAIASLRKDRPNPRIDIGQREVQFVSDKESNLAQEFLLNYSANVPADSTTVREFLELIGAQANEVNIQNLCDHINFQKMITALDENRAHGYQNHDSRALLEKNLLTNQINRMEAHQPLEVNKIVMWATALHNAGLKYANEGDETLVQAAVGSLHAIRDLMGINNLRGKQPDLLTLDQKTDLKAINGLISDLEARIGTTNLKSVILSEVYPTSSNNDLVIAFIEANPGNPANINNLKEFLALHQINKTEDQLVELMDKINFKLFEASLEQRIDHVNNECHHRWLLEFALIKNQTDYRIESHKPLDVDKILQWSESYFKYGNLYVAENNAELALGIYGAIRTIRDQIGVNILRRDQGQLLTSDQVKKLQTINDHIDHMLNVVSHALKADALVLIKRGETTKAADYLHHLKGLRSHIEIDLETAELPHDIKKEYRSSRLDEMSRAIDELTMELKI